jgi:hypothetical protein
MAVPEAKLPPGSRSGLKHPLGILESSRHDIFSGGDDGRGYVIETRAPCKITGGSILDLSHWGVMSRSDPD